MDFFSTRYCIDCPEGALSAVLEDSIMHKGHPVAAGSKILENFISPLDATVVTRLDDAVVSILGKTKMDEFGAGGLLLNSEFRIQDSELEIQDSELSTGAVNAVAEGVASFALCNDYTGAISRAAAAKDLCYIHPTYGTVSRYGLVPAVPSMDQIGIVCKTPTDGRRLLSVIAGFDHKDGAMFNNSEFGIGSTEFGIGNSESAACEPERIAKKSTSLDISGNEAHLQINTVPDKQLRIGIPTNVISEIQHSEIKILNSSLNAVTDFSKNFETVNFELKYYDIYTQVMQILCCAELSNNLTRYDGIKFGYRADGYRNLRELYTKSRTEAFGEDAKLASIIGSMVLSQEYYTRFYDKAMRIRRLIKESLEFDRYDAIILPTCAKFGVRGSEFGIENGQGSRNGGEDSHVVLPEEVRKPSPGAHVLALHALPRLCGLPAITMPYRDGGITLVAEANCENILFSAFEAVEI